MTEPQTPERRELRTLRLDLFEIWEEGADFPLYVTSDGSIAQQHKHEYPEDTVVLRWWVREGGETR